MRKKNILIINRFAGIPGVSEQSMRHFVIAENFKELNYKVTIICSQNHYNSVHKNKFENNKRLKIEGINYIIINELIFNKKNLFTKALSMFYFSFNLFLKLFFKKLKLPNEIDFIFSSSPDIFTSFVSTIYAKSNNIKHIIEIRDIWPLSQIVHHQFSPYHPLIVLMSRIEKYIYRNSDVIVSTCHNFDIYLNENKIFKPFLFIPPLIKEYSLTKEVITFDNFSDNYEKIGIYAGTIGNFYEMESLIINFPENLKDKIGIVLVGGGDAFNKINDLISDYNRKNFIMIPYVTHNTLSKYYNSADFAITKLPLKDELYKYGINQLKIADYMYHKLPVLFIGNPSHICISKEHLFVCDNEDPLSYRDIFNKIDSISKDKLNEIGFSNSRYIRKNFNAKPYVEKLEKLIRIANF